MDQSNNVILFPKPDFDFDRMPTDEMSMREKIETVKTTYAEEVSDEALEACMMIFKNYGFYTRPDKHNMKDIVAISEIIKSTLLRYNDIEHPLQKVVDEVIQLEEIAEG